LAKSNFIVRGGGDFSGLYKSFNTAQKRMNIFQKSMTSAVKKLTTALSVVAAGKLVKDSIKSAMTIESSMTQLGRTMGNSANAFENWAETQAKSFGMAREEAFKYGSTYSNLISSFVGGAAETAKYTTELLKASAVTASATGRTMEDTLERIRSGLLGNTEAIEDLGIHVNVAMLESTEAFKQFAKGRSWQQLTFQEQQQIRLLSILEQANRKYGDSLAGTTQTKQMIFLATLKDIRTNIGQAFLPIYNVILPALNTLASKIEYVTRVFAAFSQALFGKATTIQTKQTQEQTAAVSDLGDAAEEAGKKAKGALAGFDEINQLDIGQGQDAAGSTGIGVTGVELQKTEDSAGGAMDNIASKAQEMAVKVKQAFTDFKNIVIENKDIIIPALGAIAGAFAGLAISLGTSSLTTAITGFGTAIKGLWAIISAHPIAAIVTVIGALVGALVTAYMTNDKFKARVDALWERLSNALKPIITEIGKVFQSVWVNVLTPLGQYIKTGFTAAWQVLGNIISWVWQNVLVPLGNFLLWMWNSVFIPLGRILIDVLGVAFSFVADIAKSFWQNVLVPLGDMLLSILKPAIEAVSAVLSFLWNSVFVPFGTFLITSFKLIVEGLITDFEYLWKKVLKPLTEFVGGTFINIFDSVFRSIGTIINGLKTTFIGLMDFITGVFTSNWGKAWEGVKSIFKGVFDSLWGIVKFPLNLIIDGINTVIGALNSIRIDIPDWVPGLGGKTFGINIPKIPKLARGGIVTSPTLAMIGERGPEAVVPLENTGFVDAIASAVGTAVMSALQFVRNDDTNGDIVLNIDGRTFARIVKPYLEQEKRRIGEDVLLNPI